MPNVNYNLSPVVSAMMTLYARVRSGLETYVNSGQGVS